MAEPLRRVVPWVKPAKGDHMNEADQQQVKGGNMSKVIVSDKKGQPLKYDEGKIDLSLVEPWLEEAIAKVYTVGLMKYRRDSWKEFPVEEARKLIAPAKRHLNQYRKGEYYDPDDGLPHLIKAAWNLLTIYYHEDEAAANGKG